MEPIWWLLPKKLTSAEFHVLAMYYIMLSTKPLKMTVSVELKVSSNSVNTIILFIIQISLFSFAGSCLAVDHSILRFDFDVPNLYVKFDFTPTAI